MSQIVHGSIHECFELRKKHVRSLSNAHLNILNSNDIDFIASGLS
jgi:hypothetical protein